MDRATSTVTNYLAQYIAHEKLIDSSAWVAPDVAARVRVAVQKMGMERLAPIFEQLGGNVPYDQIRIVVACLANEVIDVSAE